MEFARSFEYSWETMRLFGEHQELLLQPEASVIRTARKLETY